MLQEENIKVVSINAARIKLNFLFIVSQSFLSSFVGNTSCKGIKQKFIFVTSTYT